MTLKTFDVVGWTWNGQCYCPECAAFHPAFPKMKADDHDGGAIFRDSESDRPLHCADCGDQIENAVYLPETLYAQQ